MSDAIRVEGVSKIYARYASRRRFATLKSAVLGGSLLRDLKPAATFSALREVSFRVRSGTTVAVIGANGSGKSTLLKLLAGILKPTSGRVDVTGRVAALIELGAGFHPEVSGRENIVINGIMLGLGRREIERRLPDIVRFAGLEEFIDAPVKTYSSGMYVRLGFSVAVAVEPDVLLVDEVLAVGDEAFSHKCLDRFRDLKRRGRTVLLVTHALDLAVSLADQAIWIEDGRLAAQGQPREVIDRYRGRVDERENLAGAATAPAAPERQPTATGPPDPWQPARWGNREVEIAQVRLLGEDGARRTLFHTGEGLALELDVLAHQPQDDFVFGIAIHHRDGHLVYGTNTQIEAFTPRRLAGEGRVRMDLTALPLLEGSYSLDVAVHRRDGLPFDYRRAVLSFQVRSSPRESGISRLPHVWRFEGGIEVDPP